MTDQSTYDNIPTLITELKKISNSQINIGILDKLGDSKLQMIAQVNNDGCHIVAKNKPYLVIPTKDVNGQPTFRKVKSVDIPARHFLETTIIDHEDEWQRDFVVMASNLVIGGLDAVTVMNRIGKTIVDDMKNEIKGWSNPENAVDTIRAKGFNDPLVDTGKLHDSIDFEITTKHLV